MVPNVIMILIYDAITLYQITFAIIKLQSNTCITILIR